MRIPAMVRALKECLFCEIVAGRIPSPEVLATDLAVVIRDIAPVAPKHFLVLAREHVESLNEARPELVAGLFEAAQLVAVQEGFDQDGYRAVINVLDAGGQTVRHLHVHLLAGRTLSWPPG
jgi:histidine triad (HIT) family protein